MLPLSPWALIFCFFYKDFESFGLYGALLTPPDSLAPYQSHVLVVNIHVYESNSNARFTHIIFT